MSAIAPIGIPHPTAIEIDTAQTMSEVQSVDEEKPQVRERVWGLAARTDASVTFEEYVHWAKVEREMEREDNAKYIEQRGPRTVKGLIMDRFSKGHGYEENKAREKAEKESRATVEKNGVITAMVPDDPLRVTDAEWRNAARALRTAGWGTIFYLVTTDILGWSSAPSVFAAVGFGPGVALFVIFGLAAAFSGYGIWQCFIGLDSARFPMMSFGDPVLRIFGPKYRHFINFAQALQQFLSVAVVVLGNATLLSQIAKNKICFVVVIVIVTVVGILSGAIRTLQRLGWVCNLSVWLNVVNFIIIMVASAQNPINYEAVFSSTLIKTADPVHTFAGPPPAKYQQQVISFANQFGAVDNMVYAYSGALLFVAFMAEMRHPMDFWKGMLMAQGFICVVYIFFGAFVYGHWGQYAIFNINTVVLPYSLQTAGNVLSLLTGWFAVFLYFNIGMKTVYLEVFQEVFHFPPIYTKKGKIMWYCLGPIYWVLAFIVAASVPNLSGLVGFIGGLFSLNFTYSFPAMLFLGFRIQQASALPGEGFDPVTGVTTRHDTGIKRWSRGYLKMWYLTIPTTLYCIAALACSGMGTWAAVEGLISIFGPGGTIATNFGCGSPTG